MPTQAKIRTPVQPVLEAHRRDRRAILLTGPRGFLDDLVVSQEGRLRTQFSELRVQLAGQLGLVLVEYALSRGIDWDPTSFSYEGERAVAEKALRRFHLWGETGPPGDVEVPRVLRDLGSLLRTPAANLGHWTDGRPMGFAVLLRFFEHMAPDNRGGAVVDPEQLVAAELAAELGSSLALRTSGNLLLVQGRDGMIHDLVCRSLDPVALALPDLEEKRIFLEAAMGLYENAYLGDGLEIESLARLTSRLPNRGLEAQLRAAHRESRVLEVSEILDQKAKDVERISEGTLALLDTRRVADVRLCGRNVTTPLAMMQRLGDGLLAGDTALPGNVLLAGAPATGKTDLALLAAARAKATAFELVSPKRSLVGETERLTRLQMSILGEAGGIGFIDEITEAFPMQRSEFDGDSGASKAVLASLLTCLSDESRRGRVLLIATTNCPWRIGAAMVERFTLVPVLQALPDDYPDILLSLVKRVDPNFELDPNADWVLDAARSFAEKGASPRHMRAALGHQRLLRGALDEGAIHRAAADLVPPRDRTSAIYADLWAIQACTLKSFLPWAEDPSQYPYPDYLDGIVDCRTGVVDQSELRRRIEELRPHANV